MRMMEGSEIGEQETKGLLSDETTSWEACQGQGACWLRSQDVHGTGNWFFLLHLSLSSELPRLLG